MCINANNSSVRIRIEYLHRSLITYLAEANLDGGIVMQEIVKKKVKMRTTRMMMRNRMTMMMKMALLMVAQCRRPLKRCCLVLCHFFLYHRSLCVVKHCFQICCFFPQKSDCIHHSSRQLQPCVWVLGVFRTLLMHRAWLIFLVCTLSNHFGG